MATWRTTPAWPYELGDGQGDALYPSTMCRVGAVDAERALAAVGSFGAIDALMRAAADRYRFPREGAILRPQRNRSEWRVNVTQVANAQGRAVDATDAWQLSAGEIEGRRQVVEYLRFLRAEVPGFERTELIDIGTQLGVRETRRVRGAYRLTGDDVLGGARFADTIGLNAWPIERHARDASNGRSRATSATRSTSCHGACWCRLACRICWWSDVVLRWSTRASRRRVPAARVS
jgi:hypothetical protein